MPHFARNGMVVSSQPLATAAGVRILMNGGNTVDAAIATAAVLGVVEPGSIGIGGDAFCLFYSAKDKVLTALDASGRSPQAMNLDFCRRSGFKAMPQRGIHSVTIAGAVHGWARLLNSYGSKTLGEVLHSAIRHADEGFPGRRIDRRVLARIRDELEVRRRRFDQLSDPRPDARKRGRFLRIRGWQRR
jgi:gamma-glutamyltranspeptidase/glutathione hydrolase